MLVVYYSASGNTEAVAGYIAQATNADTLELVPVEPYSDVDLDQRFSSRTSEEDVQAWVDGLGLR